MTRFSRLTLAFFSILVPTAVLAQPAPAAQPPAQPPPPSPLTIRLGDADFLIGGFLDAASVTRSTNVGSGLPTTYANIPFANTAAGQLHETRLTSQSSRVSLLVTSKVGAAAVKGYLEADFLGAGPANAFVTTNGHTMRLRLAWVQYSRGAFEFTGGQSYTLLTPNRTGISPSPGDIFLMQVVDPNFHVGLPWARQTQFRFVAHPSKTVAAAVSLENPQPYVGPAVVLPPAFPVTEVDQIGTPSAPSPYPDIVGKVTFDPQTGATRQHFEVAALVRGFKTHNPTTETSFSATGTGFSASAIVEPVKGLRVIGTTLLSDGGGRYMIGLAPDFMVNADASITTIGARSFLAGVEAQVRPPTMVFGYYGTVRIDQEVASDAGKPIGYGITGSTLANHTIDETTVGVNHAFFREPRYGALHLIVQYSYVSRAPWAVPQGTPSSAKTNMVYVIARYVLP